MAELSKTGYYRLTKDEGSALVKEEQLRRRNLRFEEVRLQSRSLAASIRQRVQKKKEDEINLLKRKVCPGISVTVEMMQEEIEQQCKSKTQDPGTFSKDNRAINTENRTALQECVVEEKGKEALELLSEQQKIAEAPDLPHAGAIDASLASPAKILSREKSCLSREDSNFETPRTNPMAKALAEMSHKEKEIFGDTLSPVCSPKSPVMPPLRLQSLHYSRSRSPLVPHQGSPTRKLKDRVVDAAVREQRRKNALKLLEELEKIDKERMGKYSECKENMGAHIEVDKMGDHLRMLHLKDSAPRHRPKQLSGNEVSGYIRLKRAVALSSPQVPVLRHALGHSLKTPMEHVKKEPYSPGHRGTPGRSPAFGDSAVIDAEHDEETAYIEQSECDSSRFQNITLRRPSRKRCTLLSPEVDDSPGASAKFLHDGTASPCMSSSGNSSSGTSATSYLGLPERFGFACAEAHIQRCGQEGAAHLKQLSPGMYFRAINGREGEEGHSTAGSKDILEDIPARDSPVQSPGSLDTAFIETSPYSGLSPVSQVSSHGLSSVSQLSSPHGMSPMYQTSPAWRCEPDGSSPSPVVNTPGNTSKSKEETDLLQYIETKYEGDSSPGEDFCGQSPRPRPPSMVRMLANQEVLIPHQLSTIAEIDTSASSKTSSGSSRRLSEEGDHERSTPKDFKSIFMGLERNIDAVEAELRAMHSFLPYSSQPRCIPSLTEESLLMNVAQPTLLAADASCGMFEQSHVICPSTASPMSDSLRSFLKHEESFARAEADEVLPPDL